MASLHHTRRSDLEQQIETNIDGDGSFCSESRRMSIPGSKDDNRRETHAGDLILPQKMVNWNAGGMEPLGLHLSDFLEILREVDDGLLDQLHFVCSTFK